MQAVADVTISIRQSGRSGAVGPGAEATRCWPAVAAILSVLLALFAREALATEVRAGLHDGFARLVIEWPDDVSVERRQEGQNLRLRFDRPLQADLEPALAVLQDYIAHVARDDDRSLSIGLRPDVELGRFRSFRPGLIALDFFGPQAEPEASSGSVDARVTGQRLSLKFGDPVVHRLEREGRSYVLTFNQDGHLDLAEYLKQLKPWLEELASHAGPRTGIAFELRPGVQADVYALGESEVVVYFRKAEEPAAAEAGPLEAASNGSASAVGDEALESRAERAAEPGAGAVQAPVETRPSGSRPTPVAGAIPPDDDEFQRIADQQAPTLTFVRTGAGLDIEADWPNPVSAAVFSRAGVLWLVFDGGPDARHRPQMLAADPKLRLLVGAPEVDQPVPGIWVVRLPYWGEMPFAVETTTTGWRVRLRPDAAPPPAAEVARAFEPARLLISGRGGRPFRIADSRVGDSLTVWPLAGPVRGMPEHRNMVQLDLLESAHGIVIREVADGVETRRHADHLEIATKGGLDLSRQAGAGSTTPGFRAEAADPQAARAAVAAASVADEQDLAALAELPPAAIEGRERAVEAPPEEDSPGRVHDLSPSDTRVETDVPPAVIEAPAEPGNPDEPARAALGLASFAIAEGALPQHRARLLRKIDAATDGTKDRARLDLARLFLAQAMAAETLAVLEGITPPAPDASLSLARQSLAGAADLLLGRLRRAEEALQGAGLDGDPEAALWRAALAAAKNDWQAAADELGRSESTLAGYPEALQLKLGMPAAMIALETGAPSLAFEILEQIGGRDLHPRDEAQLDFIRGLAHARSGEIDEAARIWRKTARSGVEEIVVKAEYALASSLFSHERISAAEALERLESQRPLWRGHPWQASMLDGLAGIEAVAGKPAAAIRTWQDVTRLHPAAANDLSVEDKIGNALRQALISPGPDPLGPLRALALYRDHGDLLPSGFEGQQLRLALAEQLADLDLVDPARLLLGEVLAEEPASVEAARAGAMLAQLALREAEPQNALAALDATQASGLARDLAAERLTLRVRALHRLRRSNEALQLLEGRTDPLSQEIRNDIFWQQRDWRRLASSLQTSLRALGPSPASLSREEQAAVLKLAIAESQTDGDGILEVSRRFSDAMRDTPAAAAFAMATSRASDRPSPEAILAATQRQLGAVLAYLEQPSRSSE